MQCKALGFDFLFFSRQKFVMSNQDLTEDQLKFLKECEVEFANRFTEADRGMAEDDWNLT